MCHSICDFTVSACMLTWPLAMDHVFIAPNMLSSDFNNVEVRGTSDLLTRYIEHLDPTYVPLTLNYGRSAVDCDRGATDDNKQQVSMSIYVACRLRVTMVLHQVVTSLGMRDNVHLSDNDAST